MTAIAGAPPGELSILKDYRPWVIAGVALVLGLYAAVRHFNDDPAAFRGDEIAYHWTAVTLVEEGRFEGTYRAPGYPLLVAAVYAVCGPRPFAVYIVQAVLFAAALVLVGQTIFWMIQDRTTAIVAMSLCAVFPPFYAACVVRLVTECLALFLVGVFVVSFLAAVRVPSCRRCALAGLALAALAYTKQIMLPFAAIAAVYLVWRHRGKAGVLRNSAVFVAVAALAILPWTCRNYLVTGRLVPISTGFGTSLWIGWWPPAYHEAPDRLDVARAWPHTPPDVTAAIAGMSEVQRDDYLAKTAVSYISAAPGTAAVNALHKFSILWLGNLGADVKVWPSGRRPLLSLGPFAIPALAIVLVPLFLLATGGYCLLPSESKRRAAPVAMLLGWWTFAYLLTVAEGRYVLPVYPYVLGFAATAVVTMSRVFRSRRRGAKPVDSPVVSVSNAHV